MNTYPVAIITGASKGIGKACSIGLSQKGYRAVLVARTESTLNEVAHEIKKHQLQDKEQTPLVYPLDVTNDDKIIHFVHEIVEQFGRIDVLINNAGLTIKGTLNISEFEFEQLFNANLRAPFSFLKAVVPIMKTILWILELSPGACVKEIVIECHKSIA